MSEDGGGGGGRSPIIYVAIGCGIAVLLALCGVGGCLVCTGGGVAKLIQETKAPAEEAHAFFRDLRGQRFAEAYARMSPEYRATRTLDAFQGAIATMPEAVQQVDSTFTARAIQDGTARLGGLLTPSPGTQAGTPGARAHPIPVAIELVEKNGKWVVATLTVGDKTLP